MIKKTELKIEFCLFDGGFCPYWNDEYEFCFFYKKHIPFRDSMPVKKPEFCRVTRVTIEEEI